MDFLQNNQVTQQRLEYRLKRNKKGEVPELDLLKQQLTVNTIKECDICKQVKIQNDFKFLVCNHHICKYCYYQIKKRNRNNSTCPFCREKLAGQDDVKQIILTISIPSQNYVLRQTRENIIFPYRINTVCEADSAETYEHYNEHDYENTDLFSTLDSLNSINSINSDNDNTNQIGDQSLHYINLSMGYVIIQIIYKIRAILYGICLFFLFTWE